MEQKLDWLDDCFLPRRSLNHLPAKPAGERLNRLFSLNHCVSCCAGLKENLFLHELTHGHGCGKEHARATTRGTRMILSPIAEALPYFYHPLSTRNSKPSTPNLQSVAVKPTSYSFSSSLSPPPITISNHTSILIWWVDLARFCCVLLVHLYGRARNLVLVCVVLVQMCF
jgi:hypothetical protein